MPLKFAVPGNRQALCGRDPYADAGEAPRTDPDEDPVRPATAEHFVEHGNQTFAVAAADQLILMRNAGAIALE